MTETEFGPSQRSIRKLQNRSASRRCRDTRVGRCFIPSLLLLAFSLSPEAAELQLYGLPGVSHSIILRGEIRPGDDKTFARIVKEISKEPVLHIDSNGGDVQTALQIGRILREREATISVGFYVANSDGTNSRTTATCYSACVLIFAGAVRRQIVFEHDNLDNLLGKAPTPVGVHRVYFGSLRPGRSQLEVKREYDNILDEVRTYLSDMDVSPAFLPFMQSINPEDMHLMTGKELEQYGLGNLNIVYEEREIAFEASLRGITSAEWRQRKRQYYSAAAALAQGRINAGCNGAVASPSGFDSTEQKRYVNSLAAESESDCLGALEAGISLDEYHARVPQAKELCGRYTTPSDAGHCLERYLATGRAPP